MMPCDDCGSRETKYVDRYKTILCAACEKKRGWQELVKELGLNPFKWIMAAFFYFAARANAKSLEKKGDADAP